MLKSSCRGGVLWTRFHTVLDRKAASGCGETAHGKVGGQARKLAYCGAILLAPAAAGASVAAAGQVAVTGRDRWRRRAHEICGLPFEKHRVSHLSISDPYRVVVDLPEANIQVPAGGRGLVLSSRSGRLAAGKSRIVIDLAEPALVEKSGVLPPENGLPARLVIELTKSTHTAFLAKIKCAAATGSRESGAGRPSPAERDLGRQKGVIVVDPRGMEGLTQARTATPRTRLKRMSRSNFVRYSRRNWRNPEIPHIVTQNDRRLFGGTRRAGLGWPREPRPTFSSPSHADALDG